MFLLYHNWDQLFFGINCNTPLTCNWAWLFFCLSCKSIIDSQLGANFFLSQLQIKHRSDRLFPFQNQLVLLCTHADSRRHIIKNQSKCIPGPVGRKRSYYCCRRDGQRIQGGTAVNRYSQIRSPDHAGDLKHPCSGCVVRRSVACVLR